MDNVSPPPEPTLENMLLRDGAVILAVLSIWAAADTWYSVTGLGLAQALAVADAILAGVVIGVLLHEWGHYAGARAAGASVRRIPIKGLSIFRFTFDFEQNDVRQFHWMTYGGHILPWAALIALAVTLPMENLSRITLIAAVFGFIVFTTVIEFPVIRDTYAGADPQSRLQQLNRRIFNNAGVFGALSGLFAVALIS